MSGVVVAHAISKPLEPHPALEYATFADARSDCPFPLRACLRTSFGGVVVFGCPGYGGFGVLVGQVVGSSLDVLWQVLLLEQMVACDVLNC
jgi:hypothetical protein